MPKTARFSGGASRSPVWCQMAADILGFPIEVMDCTELGAMGAAICAGTACGTWNDPADAVRHMCRIARTYLPNPERTGVYRKKYEQYQRAVRCLDTFYS